MSVASSMRFVSTRSTKHDEGISFTDAVAHGLAPDGGLYYPSMCANLTPLLSPDIPTDGFAAFASRCTRALFPDEFSEAQADLLCERAFSFAPELRVLDDNIMLLELFNGPSCAFKDFGACYLAAVMEQKTAGGASPVTVLTATSGDTGSAVAQAFFKRRNIRVVILYPSGRVSPLQEKQLTALGENITALEVRGSFDDCQRMVKEAFASPDVRARCGLTSANSINIGRLIPQAFYYLYAHKIIKQHMSKTGRVLFCVPSGNFGNLTAGLLAWQWGMDVQHFAAATNANNVVPNYLASGVYKPRPSAHTLANAMDVGAPSNFERMRVLFGAINMPMRNVLYGAWAADKHIANTMRDTLTRHNMFVCPHTAAGIHVARDIIDDTRIPYTHATVLATAHAGKFTEISRKICGCEPELPERLRLFLTKKKISTVIEPTTSALSDVLLYL